MNYEAPKHKQTSNKLVFGIRAVIEAIQAGQELESIYIQRGLPGGALLNELRSVMKDYDLVYQQVPVEKLNRLTPKNHQGVVAYISPITYHSLEQVIPQIFERGEVPLVLVLDRITDVRNFGAIARTAVCAGVHAILIPLKGAAQINPDAVKTSAGALYSIPVCREPNLKFSLQFLKDSGLQLLACTEKTDSAYTDADLTVPTAIIMGSEEDGISPEYLKLCDVRAKIPLIGEIASLNVSVAAGVLLYEAVRQRG